MNGSHFNRIKQAVWYRPNQFSLKISNWEQIKFIYQMNSLGFNIICDDRWFYSISLKCYRIPKQFINRSESMENNNRFAWWTKRESFYFFFFLEKRTKLAWMVWFGLTRFSALNLVNFSGCWLLPTCSHSICFSLTLVL